MNILRAIVGYKTDGMDITEKGTNVEYPVPLPENIVRIIGEYYLEPSSLFSSTPSIAAKKLSVSIINFLKICLQAESCLNFENQSITKKQLKDIQSLCPHLKTLTMSCQSLKTKSIKKIVNFFSMENLTLTHCNKIDDRTTILPFLTKNMPNLTNLTVTDLYKEPEQNIVGTLELFKRMRCIEIREVAEKLFKTHPCLRTCTFEEFKFSRDQMIKIEIK